MKAKQPWEWHPVQIMVIGPGTAAATQPIVSPAFWNAMCWCEDGKHNAGDREYESYMIRKGAWPAATS